MAPKAAPLSTVVSMTSGSGNPLRGRLLLIIRPSCWFVAPLVIDDVP